MGGTSVLRIAVLGCGRIGRMHAANIAAHPRARLAGVFDVSREAAMEVGAREATTVFETDEDVFASEGVDAVLIASSTSTHADYIEKAVAVGKAILCEKPIDLSLERVDRCARIIGKSSLPIMLGFVRRFDPTHRATRAAIVNGDIGDLHQIVITSRDPAMAPAAYMEVSGGIFRDMTIHDFDMARFLLGEEPETVSAVGSRLVNPPLMERCNDWDTVSVVLTTASGKQCVILNSRQAVYGYDQRVEVFGNKGMAVSENRRTHDSVRFTGEFTSRGAPYLNFFIERYAEAFNAEIGAFVDAVENGTAPEVGFEDGRRALVLAEAAGRSIQEGRPVETSEVI
ncbi:inositol 2-dehydrogenase [Labrys neptuniae]